MPNIIFANTDTIAAIATPPGRGGIGVVRVSGPFVPKIACAILGKLPLPRYALHANFLDHEYQPIDCGIALYFPAPDSFTGDDILELQAHGGPKVLDQILQRVLALGARTANPGEFSERAFLNNKIDLVQAEAIADLIDAASTRAAQNAMRSLQGEFSRLITELDATILALRCQVEAMIDFSDEDLELLSPAAVKAAVSNLLQQITTIQKAATQGVLLREGIKVVIAGKPNVGKSTLMNRLCGEEYAIVSERPGTTRDVLRAEIEIDGMPVHLLDTAGLHASGDEIEREGMRRTRAEIEQANHILLVVDAIDEFSEPVAATSNKTTVICNKIDLTSEAPRLIEQTSVTPPLTTPIIFLSAKTGVGINLLREHLKNLAGYVANNSEGIFAARRRHLDALNRATEQLRTAAQQNPEERAWEILAENLRVAHVALGEITGQCTSDDLLAKIFADFCVGK